MEPRDPGQQTARSGLADWVTPMATPAMVAPQSHCYQTRFNQAGGLATGTYQETRMNRSILASLLTASLFATGCTDSAADELDEIRNLDGDRPEFDLKADGTTTFVPQCPGVPIGAPEPFPGFVSLDGASFVQVGINESGEPINLRFSVEDTDGSAVIGTYSGLFTGEDGLPTLFRPALNGAV